MEIEILQKCYCWPSEDTSEGVSEEDVAESGPAHSGPAKGETGKGSVLWLEKT